MGLVSDLKIGPPRRTILDRIEQWIAATTVGTQVVSRLLPVMDTIVMRLTDGHITFSEAGAGLPTVYLTTRGA
jgi:hypothetical protein